jgi:hypothetical protein
MLRHNAYSERAYRRVFLEDRTLLELLTAARAETDRTVILLKWGAVFERLYTAAELIGKREIPDLPFVLFKFKTLGESIDPSPILYNKLKEYVDSGRLIETGIEFSVKNGISFRGFAERFNEVIAQANRDMLPYRRGKPDNSKTRLAEGEIYFAAFNSDDSSWLENDALFTASRSLASYPILGVHFDKRIYADYMIFTTNGPLINIDGIRISDPAEHPTRMVAITETMPNRYTKGNFRSDHIFIALPNAYYLGFYEAEKFLKEESAVQKQRLFDKEKSNRQARVNAEANRQAARAKAEANRLKAEANAAAAAKERKRLEYVTAMKDITEIYKDYMNSNFGIRDTRSRYNHPGLNCRYGIEIEFLSSCNRYDLANRVNSCMFNQNYANFWRKNFDPFIPGARLNDAKMLKADDNFDQYSSFFLESQQKYGAHYYRGSATCANRGISGFRIENDVSVKNDYEKYKGITVWTSNKLKVELQEVIEGRSRLKPRFIGLDENHCDISYIPTKPIIQYRLKDEKKWNTELALAADSVNFFDENELISGVLFNSAIEYPNFIDYPAHDFSASQPAGKLKYLPLGALAIDNVISHMISHEIGIAINACGFHVHLSEFPKIANERLRKLVITGFVKLFWFFEPLMYAFHPHFRASSDYAQSLQSIFTFSEITEDNNSDKIWNELVLNRPYSGTNRKIRGERYLAVNLMNCVADGIGTVEVRIGHATFDSLFIQSWIGLLQNLLRLAQALVNKAISKGEHDNHTYINTILKRNEHLIPAYVKVESAEYNYRAARGTKIDFRLNKGRPIYGFFIHSGNTPEDQENKKNIVSNLLGLLHLLISDINILIPLIPYLNYYHASSSSWNCAIHMTAIDANRLIKGTNIFFNNETDDPDKYFLKDKWNKFVPVIHGRDYLIQRGKLDFDHACKSCSKDTTTNVCKNDFNNGRLPVAIDVNRFSPPGNESLQKNEQYLPFVACPDRKNYGKTQAELINYKISPAHRQSGGRRATKNEAHVSSLSTVTMTESKKGIPFELFANPIENKLELNPNPQYAEPPKRIYRIREGAVPIQISQDGNGIRAAYVNWLGEEDASQSLTTIFNTLITKKILSLKELTALVENNYADIYVFTLDTPEHLAALQTEVVEKFKISDTKLRAIQSVYREFSQIDQQQNIFKNTQIIQKNQGVNRNQKVRKTQIHVNQKQRKRVNNQTKKRRSLVPQQFNQVQQQMVL